MNISKKDCTFKKIFILFLIVSSINIIFPIYYIEIFLAGVVFFYFIKCLNNKSYYNLIFIVIIYIFIEVSNGLNFGILFLLSLFIYIFIIPRLKYFLSSKIIFNMVIIFIFYFFIFIFFILSNGISSNLVYILLKNYILDILIVSFL